MFTCRLVMTVLIFLHYSIKPAELWTFFLTLTLRAKSPTVRLGTKWLHFT
jgi:hypothetical protein